MKSQQASISEIYALFLQNPVICTDSRNVTTGSLFFALKGPRFNGNLFASEALRKGASYAIVDEHISIESEKLIKVDNSLQTLQSLAKHHRSKFNIPVIAVVGSNGKTTTKELIHHVLAQRFTVLSTIGNLNNHIGVPTTILLLNSRHQIAVIEMGANHVGENALLCEIAMPTCGLVTNNGKDHLEGFGSMEGVIRSNCELYDYLALNGGTVFVNPADQILLTKSEKVERSVKYTYLETMSLQPNIQLKLEGLLIESRLSGLHNLENIIAATTVGLHFGLTKPDIAKGIGNYVPSNMRSQMIDTQRNRIMLDAYNANPSSMVASITNFEQFPGTPPKVMILGDMLELGLFEDQEHQAIADLCSRFPHIQTYLIGAIFCRTKTQLQVYSDCKALVEDLALNSVTNSFILIKGSRGMQLETLVSYL